MKIRHTSAGGDEKVELQMVPMIDIVFQLLIFFVLTFKIAVPEGDFNIKMPISAPSEDREVEPLLPIHVHLIADEEGNLTNIRINQNKSLGSGDAAFIELRKYIIAEVGTKTGPLSFREAGEVEFESDYQLKYHNIIAAMTAVTGYINDDKHLITLMQKIKFVPQKPQKKKAPAE